MYLIISDFYGHDTETIIYKTDNPLTTMNRENLRTFAATKMNGRVQLDELKERHNRFDKEREQLKLKSVLQFGNFTPLQWDDIVERCRQQKRNLVQSDIWQVSEASLRFDRAIVILRSGLQLNIHLY